MLEAQFVEDLGHLAAMMYSVREKLVQEKGLADQVTVLLKDYRDMTGRFDRIISIEMLEAIGPEYYGTFFRQCEKLLEQKGTIGQVSAPAVCTITLIKDL